jgi:hypothetical protein
MVKSMLLAKPWFRVARFVLAALLAAVWLLVASAALDSRPVAADSGLTAVVTPSQVTLIPGASAKVVLVVTNATSTATTITDVNPETSDASVTVTGDSSNPALSTTVAPSSSTAFVHTVTRAREATAQDLAVTFVVNYSGGAVVANLTVKAGASPAVVQAAIQSNVTTINENRPGEAALVITNPREARIDVSSIQVKTPSYVNVALTCPNGAIHTVNGDENGATLKTSATDCPVTVEARSQEVLPLVVSTADTLAPGPRTVIVKVNAIDSDGGVTGTAVVTLPFTLEVYAESDLLKFLGVTIFLLLPGVVLVVTAWFLVQQLSPWRDLLLNVKQPEIGSTVTITTILGLGVSLAMAKAYPFLTARVFPGHERNYLMAYGFRDFYYVFGYSLAIAAAVWVLACIAALSRPLLVPSAHDQPLTLLRKAGFNGLVRRRTTFLHAYVGNTNKGLYLGPRHGDKVLVTPEIQVAVGNAANQNTNLKTTIEGFGTSRGRLVAWKQWRTISNEMEKGTVTSVTYRPADDVAEPKLLDASTVSRSQESPLVRVQDA